MHKCVINTSKNEYPRWIGVLFAGYQEEYLSKEIFIKSVLEKGISTDIIHIQEVWKKLQKECDEYSDIISFKKVVRALKTHYFDKMFYSSDDETRIFVSPQTNFFIAVSFSLFFIFP